MEVIWKHFEMDGKEIHYEFFTSHQQQIDIFFGHVHVPLTFLRVPPPKKSSLKNHSLFVVSGIFMFPSVTKIPARMCATIFWNPIGFLRSYPFG